MRTDRRLREALQRIADLEAEWYPWVHPDPGCDICANARARSWPPSGLCNAHYASHASWSSKMARNMDLTTQMRVIARTALDGSTEREES